MRRTPSGRSPGTSSASMVDAFHRRGHRGHPRHRVQPHGRGGRRTGRPTTSAAWTTALYYMLDEHGRYLNFSRLRQHVQQRPPGRPQLPDRLPAELGRRGAGSTGSGSTWPRSSAATGGATSLVNPPAVNRISEDSLLYGTKLIAEPWDAAGLYQVGTFPGRSPLVGLERPLSRRRPQVLARRAGHDLGPGHPDLRQRRPVRTAAGRCTRSTSSAATTVSRSTTWSPTTRSTTRPTARGTATATTPTGAGTAASRGRPTIPAVNRLRERQVAQPDGDAAGLAGSPHDPGRATSSSAPRRETTTPGARTTARAGSTGR